MQIITTIDFGSSKTTLAVFSKETDGLHAIHWGSAQSEGIKFGEITNQTKCVKVLQQLIGDAEKAVGEKIREAVVSISGRMLNREERKVETERIFSTSSIDRNEIESVTGDQYRSSDEKSAVLEVSPQQYNVDDQYNVEFSDLEGMRGKKLESYFKVFSGKSSLVETRSQVLKECGIRMRRAILSPIAASRAILTDQEREKGVVLVDMGKDLTEISIVRSNVVRDLFILPFAGESVTKDIANVTEISSSWAEAIKVKYGYCLEEVCPENKTLELVNEDGESDAEVDMLLLTRVVESRVSEIFDAVKYLVGKSKFADKLPAGYVLTGGSAYLSYILPLAKTILGAKVRLAAPRSCITPDSEKGAFDAGSSVAVGLALEHDHPVLTTVKSSKGESVVEPQVKKENVSGGLFSGFFSRKEPRKEPVKEPVKEVKPVAVTPAAAQKPAPKKKKDSVSWLGDFFSDEGHGNKA